MDDELLADLEAVEREQEIPPDTHEHLMSGDDTGSPEPKEDGELQMASSDGQTELPPTAKRPPEQSQSPKDLSKRPRLPSPRPVLPPHVPLPAFNPLTPPVVVPMHIAPMHHTLLPEQRKALAAAPSTPPSNGRRGTPAPLPVQPPPKPAAMSNHPATGILPAPHVPLPPPVMTPGMYPYVPMAQPMTQGRAPHATPPMWSQDMRALNSVRPGEKLRLTLRFGNISPDTRLSDLESLFRTIGPVRSINLNTPTREGTVTFYDANTALQAKRRLHRYFLRGQNISVDFQ